MEYKRAAELLKPQRQRRTLNVKAIIGVLISLGFIAISAASNFAYGQLIGTQDTALIYGAAGILTTLINSYAPIRMADAMKARKVFMFAAAALLFFFSLAFSVSSAVGFAGTMRDTGTKTQAALSANYEMTLKALREIEEIPPAKRTNTNNRRVEELRTQLKTYREKGAMKTADVQSELLKMFGVQNGGYWIALLFAVLIEVAASLSMYVALAETKR